MRCRLMLAALALLTTFAPSASNAGRPLGFSDSSPIDVIYVATAAGTRDRCPKFKAIDHAIDEEIAAANITQEMLRNEQEHVKKLAESIYIEYLLDSSSFCSWAWGLLGPNGTYRRQMLEAK
jgi:hypothetical protein